MGLSGSGKTTLAKVLLAALSGTVTAEWFNADEIRKQSNNWDFSPAGRMQQCRLMHKLADQSESDVVICDFIAPTVELRETFNADYTIWMNTALSSKFSDTDALFVSPDADYTITEHHEDHLVAIVTNIKYLLSRLK